jgi:hypothetical protein
VALCAHCMLHQGEDTCHIREKTHNTAHQAGDTLAAVPLNPANVVSEQRAADQQAALQQHKSCLTAKRSRHTTAQAGSAVKVG